MILDGIHKLSRAGCEKSEAEILLAQARVDWARRDESDRRIGVMTDDILTKGDVTTALNKYHQLNVEPSKLIIPFKTRAEEVVLPDFWKHWALELDIGRSNRGNLYKLDFNKEDALAENFTPHGAAATILGNDNKRRFVIWQGFQLYGDVEERLGLNRKLNRKEWKVLIDIYHPNAPQKDAYGRSILYRCPGDICLPSYQMPSN